MATKEHEHNEETGMQELIKSPEEKIPNMVAEPVRSMDNDRTGDEATGALEKLQQAIQRIEGKLDEVLNVRGITDAQTMMCNERQLKKAEKLAAQEEEEISDDMGMAIGSKGYVRGKVDLWFVEKGYGFVQVGSEVAFVHVTAVWSGESLPIGQSVVMKVVHDHSKPGYKIKAVEAWAMRAWQAKQATQTCIEGC